MIFLRMAVINGICQLFLIKIYKFYIYLRHNNAVYILLHFLDICAAGFELGYPSFHTLWIRFRFLFWWRSMYLQWILKKNWKYFYLLHCVLISLNIRRSTVYVYTNTYVVVGNISKIRLKNGDVQIQRSFWIGTFRTK